MSATSPAASNYWRIDGIPDQIDNVPLDAHPGPEETRSYGATYTLEIHLSERSDPEGAEWPPYLERFQTLRETYAPHAGQYSLHRLLSGRVAYVSAHTGPSLLIAVRPPLGTVTGQGGYYLVDGVTDQTTLPERLCRLDVDVTYLAPLSAYNSLEAALSFLEAPGI